MQFYQLWLNFFGLYDIIICMESEIWLYSECVHNIKELIDLYIVVLLLWNKVKLVIWNVMIFAFVPYIVSGLKP